MAQYKITLDSEIVQGIFQKDGGLSKLVEQVLNQVLDAQVGEQLQAEPYERTEKRQGYRNGYREREMVTRVGTITLDVPLVRNGAFSTELFARYQRSEQALILALMEMVVNGVSTRKVRRVTEELCGTSFSKSTVSDLCRQLDGVVVDWNQRRLDEKGFPFLIVDALVLKVRKDGHIRSQSALLAIGVNDDGYREILGLRLGDSESRDSWGEFFTWLKGRGLHGVDLVTSDDHAGLVQAIGQHFQNATWQRCQTHLTRNILDACPKALHDSLHSQLRALFTAPDQQVARNLLDGILAAYSDKAPQAMQRLENGFDDAIAILAYPEPYRKRLRTTNIVERLNEEIRRRERVIRIFPNGASVQRLLGALLMEQDEIWSTGRKYFDMTAYWEWRKPQAQAAD
ncbi:MAG: IS256 family transposase [Thermaerobacter sp.]|nr:IS256 family transposase [Thermaerobacter sp.]